MQPQRVTHVRSKRVDGTVKANEAHDVHPCLALACTTQVIAILVGKIDDGAPCVHGVADLFENTREQRRHICRFKRVEHDLKRA